MAIKKKVAVAVSTASTKATAKAKAENSTKAVVEVTDWDKMLINNNSSEDTAKDDGKEYEFFNGKDRLVRTAPGWGSAAGKQVKFVIYATDADGVSLPELPPTRFGSLADVEYTEKRYPMSKGFYVADSLCKNGRHKINVYRIHITRVIDTPVEVE